MLHLRTVAGARYSNQCSPRLHRCLTQAGPVARPILARGLGRRTRAGPPLASTGSPTPTAAPLQIAHRELLYVTHSPRGMWRPAHQQHKRGRRHFTCTSTSHDHNDGSLTSESPPAVG